MLPCPAMQRLWLPLLTPILQRSTCPARAAGPHCIWPVISAISNAWNCCWPRRGYPCSARPTNCKIWRLMPRRRVASRTGERPSWKAAGRRNPRGCHAARRLHRAPFGPVRTEDEASIQLLLARGADIDKTRRRTAALRLPCRKSLSAAASVLVARSYQDRAGSPEPARD